MNKTVYVVRENHKDLGVCYVGHDYAYVRDILDSWKFPTVEAVMKKFGDPEVTTFEIIPVTFSFKIDESKAIIVSPIVEDDEEE